MGNLAIVPARGGSKRIPKKNIKDFNGKPIIGYAIETLKAVNIFDEIMVSTDDANIAKIAEQYGANIPFLRSVNNANDFATLSDVIVEVLFQYKKEGKSFDNICCLLPTAALITPEKIKEGFKALNNGNFYTVVPVVKFAYPIQRAFKDDNGLLKMREPKHINTRSQDLESCYHDSGQFYWINTKAFLQEEKIFTRNTGYIELKEYEAQDVDTPEDWAMLELKYSLNK